MLRKGQPPDIMRGEERNRKDKHRDTIILMVAAFADPLGSKCLCMQCPTNWETEKNHLQKETYEQ